MPVINKVCEIWMFINHGHCRTHVRILGPDDYECVRMRNLLWQLEDFIGDVRFEHEEHGRGLMTQRKASAILRMRKLGKTIRCHMRNNKIRIRYKRTMS